MRVPVTAIHRSSCRRLLVPSVPLGIPKDDEMNGLPIPTAIDSSQDRLNLENQLRRMILSNGMSNTDPKMSGQSPVNVTTIQHADEAQRLQPAANVVRRTPSGKQNGQSQSLGRTSSVSPLQRNGAQGTQTNGQAQGHQYLATPVPSPSSIHPQSPSPRRPARKPAPSQAQQVPGIDQASRGQPTTATGPSTRAFTGRRSHQSGYQGPSPNPSLYRIQPFTNGQRTEPRNFHVNVGGNQAIPNLTAALNSGNCYPYRYPPAQQSPYAHFNTQNRDPYAHYSRPIPQNRQLYEPSTHRPQGFIQHPTQNNPRMSEASAPAQALFLEQLAGVEVPNAAISQDELQEKEALRLVLERVCQKTITEHERKKDEAFDENSVSLKCFGSLASGFATHSADMDLALVSPHSVPESTSPESDIPRLLEKALLDLGYGVRLLTRTRVPIIRFCEKPTPILAIKLLEERAKYERERDALPKPKKPKKTGNAEKATGEEKVSTTDNPTDNQAQIVNASVAGQKPQLVSLQPTNETANAEVTKAKIIEASTTRESAAKPGSAEIYASVIENVDDAKIDELKNSPISKTIGPIVVAQDVTKVDEQEVQERADAQAATALKTERMTDLSLFTDEELVRLYNLAIKEGWYEPAERATIMEFQRAVEKHGPNSDDADLGIARSNLQALTDVLKRYRAPPEHQLDFPKIGVGIQCDINFSNQLALHNTRLLKCYGMCDPRVRPMILFVKAWAKRRRINSPYHGTLSSYGYVLMVLHYLVNIAQPAVAPNLQITRKATQDKSPENDLMIDGYNVRFWRSEDEITDLAKRGMLTHNREDTIGSLLRGFFQYFAQPHRGFSWSTDVLSLRTEGGLLSKGQKGWTGAKTVIIEPTAPGQEQKEVRHRYLFAIEDPFEVDHNIARTVVHNGIVAIRDEFRRAYSIIQSAGFGNGRRMDDLFAEAESKDNLQYRAFGPMPKKDMAPIRKEGEELDDLGRSRGKDVRSTYKSGQEVPASVGTLGGVKGIAKKQKPPTKPEGGIAPVEEGNVSKPFKNPDKKAQPQVNNGEVHVTPKTQNLQPNLTVDGFPSRGKGRSGHTKVGNTDSSQAKKQESAMSPKKRSPPVKQVAIRGPVKERAVGSVYKNGKEVAGSCGRVGEAGVIPKRPN